VFVSHHYTTIPSSLTATFDGVSLTAATGSPCTVVPGAGSSLAIWSFYMLETDMPAAGSRNVVVTVTGGAGLTARTIAVNVMTDAKQEEPEYAENSEDGPTSITIPDASTVTTHAGGVALAYAIGVSGTAWTVGGTWDERFDVLDGAGGDYRATGADETYAGNGTDSVTFTQGAETGIKAGVILSLEPVPPPSAAITGTATASITETDVVTGGKTIIITLTDAVWIDA
jgi:hypothetical protein